MTNSAALLVDGGMLLGTTDNLKSTLKAPGKYDRLNLPAASAQCTDKVSSSYPVWQSE